LDIENTPPQAVRFLFFNLSTYRGAYQWLRAFTLANFTAEMSAMEITVRKTLLIQICTSKAEPVNQNQESFFQDIGGFHEGLLNRERHMPSLLVLFS
jgi:hypothetical protein